MTQLPSFVRYLLAVLTVGAALGVRFLLMPWTGVGAPFVFFFGTVLISSFFWGEGPGLLAGMLSVPLAGFFFVYQAGYTTSQALAQSILFLIETTIVAILTARFAKAKRRAELNERAARQAEELIENVNNALRKRETELREAQRLASFGNWSWDYRSDTVEWSDEIYRIVGRDPSLPAPRFYGEHSHVFTRESMVILNAAVEKSLQYGTPYELDLEMIRPDGELRSILARGEPVRDGSGHITGLHGTVQDVTQLKRLQKMREEWTSVIAHDLRQPIGTIAMCADLLSRADDSKKEEKAKYTDRIRSSAFNLARMVDDLLDFSQIEAQRLHLERKWMDPRACVRETIERLSHMLKDLRVEISESGDLAPVFADPIRVEQVLGNLLSNAVKYGDKTREILVRLDRRGDELETSVTNHGPGIPPEELSRLFDRFTRSQSVYSSNVPGLGLGLYISKGLVEAHGGHIWVESVPDDTTTFHFTLPVRVARIRNVA
jgi:signal transduction histidine kinase